LARKRVAADRPPQPGLRRRAARRQRQGLGRAGPADRDRKRAAVLYSQAGELMPRTEARRLAITVAALTIAAAMVLAPTAGAAKRNGPFFSAPFRAHVNSYTFGQTPSFARDGDVFSQEVDPGSGLLQVYRSRLNGSKRGCITCGGTPGPNGFPEERPQGDWL